MRPHDAYRQQKTPAMPRIDVILALYRKAIDRLGRAADLLAENRLAAASPVLAEVQLIVSTLSHGMAGSTDEPVLNFLRLYEFVAHQLTLKTPQALESARRVLATLLDAFETARDQAVALELQGKIPSLSGEHFIQLTA